MSSEPANAAVVVLTGALVWAGSSLLQQLLLISDVIFSAAVKCSFVTVHAPALRPHRAPMTGFIAMSLHLHEVCLQQTEGRADAMRWAPTLSPPTPSVQLSHLVSFRLQSVPPLSSPLFHFNTST